MDRIQLQREHRLLGKILAEVDEVQVRLTLQAWCAFLGGKLAGHREQTRAQQNAYDRWWRLPEDKRDWRQKPDPPALGVEVKDRSGHTWVVDDRLLLMLDDLLRRLDMWMAPDDH